jgi:NADH-quinone oxidoreductase subunit F
MAYLLLRHRDVLDIKKLDVYIKNGGFESFKKAVTSMQPGQVMDEVKASGLRGRGGAGFPTGVKWSFIPKGVFPTYMVANADESEPGTFKDHEIMEGNPYQFLEGVAIACYAIQSNPGYVYLRGEFQQVALQLDACLAEMEKAGFLGDNLFGTNYSLRIHTHLGAGAYICGEETALLESIEGKRGQPRIRPPFPAVHGLYGKPTVINNVETLTNVPLIIEKGAAWYRSIGTDKSLGVKVFSLSGNVTKPGNYELPLGTTFRELIFTYGGGIPNGRKIKAIMPAGASSSIIPVNDETFDKVMDTPMDYENMQNLGSQLGSASVIVIDDSHGMDWVINKTIHFFKHESCGKCTPCRIGTRVLLDRLEKISAGEGEPHDLDIMRAAADTMIKASLCGLGQAASNPVTSSLNYFFFEYETHVHDQY